MQLSLEEQRSERLIAMHLLKNKAHFKKLEYLKIETLKKLSRDLSLLQKVRKQ